MTSQIAIFNSLGVAVASDTFTTHTTENRITKTTNNAEKIWSLGDEHRVVVLHSGLVHLNGVHLKLLISEWSKTLTSQLPDLYDYLESFRDWMNNNNSIISRDLQIRAVNECLNNHYYALSRKIENQVSRIYENSGEPDFKEVLTDFIPTALEALSSYEDFHDFDPEEAANVIKEYDIDLQGKIAYHFDRFSGYENFYDNLHEQASLVLAKPKALDSNSTLGFVGFGADNYFAASYRFEVKSYFADRIFFETDDRFGVSAGDDGAISTFAQADAIHGFIGGSEWSVVRSIAQKVSHALHEREDIVALDPDLSDKIYDLVFDHFESFRYEKFASPLLSTIEGLSLKGSAELAESLVGIQAIRAAGGDGPASVGGFIESLVIDRAEGVKWIKRLAR